MKVLRFFSAIILLILLVVFGFGIGKSVSGLLTASEEDANVFMKKNQIDYQQAYEQLKSKLDHQPEVIDRVYIINDEFFFPKKDQDSVHHLEEKGYYYHPQTGVVREVHGSAKLLIPQSDSK